MSIKKKTVLATIVALACLIAGLDITMMMLVRHTFSGIEYREAGESTKRGSLIISNTLKAMDKRIYDWAVWDDAYNFVQDGNKAFIDSNLGVKTMTALGFNFLLFYNQNGKLVRGECVDGAKGQYVPMPSDFSAAVEHGTNLLANKSADDRVEGIILTEKGPLLVAKRPITHSSGQGPVGGTLIAAKYLNQQVLTSLSDDYAVSLDAQPIGRSVQPDDYVLAEKQLSQGKAKDAIIPRSEEKISAYTVLNDVCGKPALVIRMDSPRTIHAQSKVMILYTTIGISIMGLIFGLFNTFWLNKTVLKPITRLTGFVEAAITELGMQ